MNELKILASAPQEKSPNIEFVDLSGYSRVSEAAVRVCLQSVEGNVVNHPKPETIPLGQLFLIGLVEPENMPRDGNSFSMFYSNNSGKLDYGPCFLPGPIDYVRKQGDYIYFNDYEEGSFRLELIGRGN